MSDESTIAGVERREMMRRMAVGAATAWVAPVVLSGPVGAQGTVIDPDPVEQCFTAPLELLKHKKLKNGRVEGVHGDVGVTFASVSSVCFEFRFTRQDPLDCKESVRFYVPPEPAPGPQYDVGFANTGSKPQLENGLCLTTSEDADTTSRWLDGVDDFIIVLCGGRHASATVASATVTVCGVVAPT
jgi:hypothetical protein